MLLKHIKKELRKLRGYFWSNTYPVQAIKKNIEKKHHGPFRRFCFNLATTTGAIIGGCIGTFLALATGYCSGVFTGYFIGGLLEPTAGSMIGAHIGGTVGLISGSWTGLQPGIQAGGFIFANIAKHTSRFISAIVNFNEVNPTNPYKYKLTKERFNRLNGINASLIEFYKMQPDKQKELASIDPVRINKRLEKCYQWKKAVVKPKRILRIIGLSFFDHSQKKLNDDIDLAVKNLKHYDDSTYKLLKKHPRLSGVRLK